MRIRHKVLAVVGLAVSMGLVASAAYYVHQQERALLAQNEQTMVRLAESVSSGLQSVMLAGSADIAQAFALNLRMIPEVSDFRIMRVTGEEAFRDNTTIAQVNERRGEELFPPRDTEQRVQVLHANDTNLQQVLGSKKPLTLYNRDDPAKATLTFMLPVMNADQCFKCHGSKSPIRGVVTLTTSLVPVERDISPISQQTVLLFGGVLVLTMLLTGYALGRAVIHPIERATSAMRAVTGGDLAVEMMAGGSDEFGRMASSFNRMTGALRQSYTNLRREQNKLATIIQSSTEGIVVSDGAERVVLVNPAACELLDCSHGRIVEEGFLALFDSPEDLGLWLAGGDRSGPYLKTIAGRRLQMFVSTIRDANGEVLGSVAQIRDITEESRLESELRLLSTTDGLTGLYNRRHLENMLRTELVRSRRTRQPVSVAMFDIDHFKRFNDTHGHDQGDRVLQAVASAVKRLVRETDIPCRYGGEEFLIILTATTGDAAFNVAEQLRAGVEALEVDGLKVSISVGVATVPDVDAGDAEALVAAADAALYEAKRSGRNRVAVAAAAKAEGSV